MGTDLRIISETENEAILRGYGVIWDGKDRAGQTFISETDLQADLVPDKPVLIEHTLEGFEGKAGGVIAEGDDDLGHWMELKVDKTIAVVKEYLDGVRKGLVGLSTGSIPHLVRRIKSVITKWPIVEVSLTKWPAEPRTLSMAQVKMFNPNLVIRLEAEQENRIEPETKVAPVSVIQSTNYRGSKMPDNQTPMDGSTVESVADMLNRARQEGRSQAEAEQQAALKRMKDEQDAEIKRQKEQREIREQAKAEAEAEFKSVRRPARALVGNKWVTKNDMSGHKQPEQTEAYLEWARTGDAGALKSLLVGDATSPEMPIDLYERIEQKASALSVARLLGATIRTTDRPSFDVAYVSTVQASASAVSEGNAISAAQPTYSKATITLFKAGNYIPVSRESLKDEYFDLESELVNQIGRSIAVRENAWFFAGVGTTEPYGLITRATTAVTLASSSGQFTYSDLTSLMGALPYEYTDGNLGMVMNRTNLYNVVAPMQVTGWLVAQQYPVQGSGPSSKFTSRPGNWHLNGVPILDVSDVSASGPNKKIVLYGAFDRYFIGQKAGGPEIIRNEFEDMNHGLVRFYYTTRLGGDLPETDAVQAILHL